MSHDTFWDAALAYACGANAAAAFAPPFSPSESTFPTNTALHAVISSAEALDADSVYRLIHFTYALAATLPGCSKLVFPSVAPDSTLAQLYPTRASREPLLAILDHLSALCESCDALPNGSFHLVEAKDDLLHFTRTGPTEILDAVFNRGPHIRIVSIGNKAAEVNPYGFTITVREHGHNSDHSYYDFR